MRNHKTSHKSKFKPCRLCAARFVELEQKIKELSALAYYDPLTKIPNRRAMDVNLEKERSRSARNKIPASVVLVDIDHFKAVNDTYGHAAGDAVLQGFATFLVGTSRPADTVARYGGEEFVLILPGATAEDAYKHCEHIRKAMAEKPFQYQKGKPPIFLTASFGIGQLIEDESPNALLKRTDRALYNSKQVGRDRATIASPPSLKT